MLKFNELRQKNQRMAQQGNYRAIDAYSGGCGMTMSAINAGLCVVTGYEIANEEIEIFEQATGQRNLGNIDNTATNVRPVADVWCSCSSCKDYSRLSKKQQGYYGSRFKPRSPVAHLQGLCQTQTTFPETPSILPAKL